MWMRGYRRTNRGVWEKRAYVRGVEAMRDAVVSIFEGIADREMNGRVAAQIARGVNVATFEPPTLQQPNMPDQREQRDYAKVRN
jgi:hypothetical protein